LQQVSGGAHARRHIHTHAVALLCCGESYRSMTEVEKSEKRQVKTRGCSSTMFTAFISTDDEKRFFFSFFSFF